MPVAKVFPDGAAAAPAGFTYNQITDFSSFTFSDPNSLVTSYSVTGGLHSVGLATLAVSNVDYNAGSGANFTGARWYFPLTYADGSAVQAGDTFVFTTKITDFSVGAARNWNLIFGVVQNATSTVLTTMDGLGTTAGTTGVGTPLTGTWRRNVIGTSSLAGGITIYGQSMFGGLPGKAKVGASAIIQSASAGSPTQGLDANTLSVADNTQMYGVILTSTLGTVTTTGGTIDFKLFYNVSKLS